MLTTRHLSIQFQTFKSEEQLWIKGPKSRVTEIPSDQNLLDTTKVSSTTVKTWLNNVKASGSLYCHTYANR